LTGKSLFEKSLNISVIGAGDWSTSYHLPALKDLEARVPVRLHGIWNRTYEKAARAADQFGFAKAYNHIEELIDDPAADCFSVLVNPKIAPGIVEQLLPRKLPIFTEKSPGWSYEDAKNLADMVQTVNVVGFNRRFMPLNREFKQIVDKMENPYFAECHFYRNNRQCSEFIIETGIHGLNFLEYLHGAIEKVRTTRCKNPQNDTYVWNCEIEFESGLPGYAKFLPCSGSSVERYEVHSNDLSAYLESPQTYSLDYPGRIVLHEKGKIKQIIEGAADRGAEYNAGFIDEYLDFFQSIKNDGSFVSNFKNSVSTMELCGVIEKGDNYSRPRTL
jgi:predicted dehydrogenase